eukprot:TRINITY_DN54182_c0_g1_i1.p1 TRINITY_DN54182_c0_g1~~TRINITY_DN54182_c0_g1_i1.p1  ORF type:complete len:375 (-),score=10.15 TRINITY_DN54182_c0_g1_i1:142-1266(-)
MYLAVFAGQVIFSVSLIFLAAVRASNTAGSHQFAMFGTVSPVIPSVVVFGILVYHRGRSIKRATGSVTIKPALWTCFFCALIFTVECVYIVGGFSTMSVDRKETLLFIYRLVIWPLIWYIGLMPLTRFCMFFAPSAVSTLPIAIFALVATTGSSRILMFRMTNPTYFLILSSADTLMQVGMNLYHGKLPVVDSLLYKYGWLRCLRPPEVSRDHAKWVRVIWFQAATFVELITVVATGFREWVFFESRYMISGLYQPSCSDAFDVSALIYKVAVSVFLVVFGDIYTGYKIYARKYPVSQGLHMFISKKRVWALVILLQLSVFALIVMPLSPVPARTGGCTDFDDGCTCQNIAMFKEICGCCSANATTAGMYPVCK